MEESLGKLGCLLKPSSTWTPELGSSGTFATPSSPGKELLWPPFFELGLHRSGGPGSFIDSYPGASRCDRSTLELGAGINTLGKLLKALPRGYLGSRSSCPSWRFTRRLTRFLDGF
eukprot:684358-Pyramimonas_sp.AAC.1